MSGLQDPVPPHGGIELHPRDQGISASSMYHYLLIEGLQVFLETDLKSL